MALILGKGFVRYGAKVVIEKAGTYEEVVNAAGIILGPKTMQRFATLIPVSEFSDKYLYVRARAVSGFEEYGPNENGDAFEWEELAMAYPTFVRGGVYKDHSNKDRKQAIGIIVDSWPNIDKKYIEVLLAINKRKAPKEVKLIESGELTDVSMGCVVDEAICSVCGNIAHDESQYCDHIRQGLKGQEVNGTPCFEYNKGVRFFEVSLISPWSEAADPDAKIKETVAAKQVQADPDGFEEWIIDHSESDVDVSILSGRERVGMSFVFGQLVLTKNGKRGIAVGGQGDVVSVFIEGSDENPHLIRADDLTPIAEEPSEKEVTEMAREKSAAMGPRLGQGEGREEHDATSPDRGNPMITRWHGDYGSPSDKFKQDYERTEQPSDPTNLRGQQMSSEIERGDYPHKGYTGDKAEGKAPIGASRERPVTAAELEEQMDYTLDQAAEIGMEYEEVKEKEVKKSGLISKAKTFFGIGKEADYTEYDGQDPNKGNPMLGRDPSDDQYNPASRYFDAQKAEADVKDAETRADIEKQHPVTYSNTPENIYEKMPKVAAAEDVDKLVEVLKKFFKEDEKKIGEFIDTVRKLEDPDFEELAKALKGVKEEEDKEVDKAKEEDKEGPPKPDKEAPPAGAPPAGPPKPSPPGGPPKPGPPKPGIPGIPGIPGGPPKPGPLRPGIPGGAPPKLPRAPGPGGSMLGDVRTYARQAAAASALSKLAALGQWGEEDPVAHAKRLVLQQISRDPSTDPTSMFWLASDVRDLDDEQMARLAGELHLEVPGITAKTASIDYSRMSNAEILGAYKVLTASAASDSAMKEVLAAMVERGIRPRIAAEKKEVLKYIYERMSQGRIPYNEAKKEAESKFDIISDGPGQPDTRPLGFGHETEGPGSSSELGHQEPSKRHLGPGTSGPMGGTNLPAGVTPRAYDERTPYRSSSMERKAADGAWLNDYEIAFGTNTRWNKDSKVMSEQENATQKKDFQQELREARKKELLARASGVTAARSFSDWKSALKKQGAPVKVLRQFEHIWKSALDDGKSEEYAARAAIDEIPEQYLEEPTKEHGPGESGPKAAYLTAEESVRVVTAGFKKGSMSDTDFAASIAAISKGSRVKTADTYTGPETIESDERGAPSVQLADDANREQKQNFQQELKEVTGHDLGRRIRVAVGASDESHLGEVKEVNPDGTIIQVDYQDGVRNRDTIDLKEGRSKVFGAVRVYTRPEILTVKKGNWIGYGDGSSWSIYNFHRESGKLAEVKLAEADPAEVMADFQLAGEEEVPEFFASRDYGEATLDKMQELEDQGALDAERGTGVTQVTAEPGEIAIKSQVVIAENWMPSGEESDELVHDIVQLRDEGVPGVVEAIDEVSDELQVDFGGDRPIILSVGELRLARDSNETGTDVRWTEESKAQADQENKQQKVEFTKEQVASSFGPDSSRNTRMASTVGQFEEHIALMNSLIRDAGLSVKEALPHAIQAFEMTKDETGAFVESDEYTEAFEMPMSPSKMNHEPEFGEGKEVTQMRVRVAGMKKHLCARIASEMLGKGMIKGVTADMSDEDINHALDSQIDKLMKLDEQGLYEFEDAVKSASDPDGVEALRKSSAQIGPREGALQQPLIMRGASKESSANTLEDENFFK